MMIDWNIDKRGTVRNA